MIFEEITVQPVSPQRSLQLLFCHSARITHARRVPDDFHARFRAQSRTYVYRIALGISHHLLTPLTDTDLCWHLRNM